MLNELLAIKRGLAAAGIQVAARHSDVKAVGKGDVLRVRLGVDGAIRTLEQITPEARALLWTLRDGQQNSFPYVKIDRPLLSVQDHATAWKDFKSIDQQRSELRQLAHDNEPDPDWMKAWPGQTLKRRVEKRLAQLEPLRASEALAVPAVFERFLAAVAKPEHFLTHLADLLLSYADQRDESWIEPTHNAFVKSLSIYFDVPEQEFDRGVGDPAQVALVSSTLASVSGGGRLGVCALSGAETSLHEGNFPQPNLPSLGQTYIFAKNDEIPAAHRYGRAADNAYLIGREIVTRLAGSIAKLTEDGGKGRTWSLIPSEKPKQSDLLLAFLPSDPALAMAAMLTDGDAAEEAHAALTKRVVKELDGSIERAFAQEQVQICIIRKVDPANRKTIYHRSPTAGEVHEAARRWREGCRNVPAYLTLPIPVPKEKRVRDATPPHVAPTSLATVTRALYASGGTRRVDVIGRPAAEAFSLFLEEGETRRRARDVLRILLARHGALLAGSAHARNKGIEHLKKFDPKSDLRPAAMRSITWIALLLHKLGRAKEDYMSESAFKLGQLLAVADVVHAGYCADLRGGDVPPTLLGNSVLTMAQANPIKALAVLCGRWKPYGAWAKRSAIVRERADQLVADQDRSKQDRGWAIRRAASQSMRVSEISTGLSGALPQRTDDRFRAELLLGYIAGLPKIEKPDADKQATSEGTSQ